MTDYDGGNVKRTRAGNILSLYNNLKAGHDRMPQEHLGSLATPTPHRRAQTEVSLSVHFDGSRLVLSDRYVCLCPSEFLSCVFVLLQVIHRVNRISCLYPVGISRSRQRMVGGEPW